MTVSHIYVGDPVVESGGTSSFRTCNCACSRCMSGSCCQFPAEAEPAADRTVTWTGTSSSPVWGCGPVGHDYGVLDPARLFCRKCGDVKVIP